jgi:hypothetical protein
MGLDISAHSYIAIKQLNPVLFEFNELMDADVDILEFNRGLDFLSQSAELGDDVGKFEFSLGAESESFDFRAGSYSTYNKFRNLVCLALLEVKCETAWDNPNKYKTGPGWDIINFSDCEGVIDSVTSAKLLKEFTDNRDKFITFLNNTSDVGDMDVNHYTEFFDNMIKCFELGSKGGIVIYG